MTAQGSIAAAVCLTLAAPAALAETRAAPRNVAIVLYEGVELLDFAGPGEVFAAAARVGATGEVPAFRVYTVAKTKDPIVSQGFVKIVPQYAMEEAPRPDLIVFPGGSVSSLTGDKAAMGWIKSAVGSAEIALSVCNGAFALAGIGALDGKTATTHYNSIARLRSEAPKAIVQEGRRFVDQGRIVTTAGVSAGIDGALHVVARLLGRAAADQTARYMEYHWTPEPYLAQTYSRMDR